MVRYRKHTVVYGDTIQSIAQKETGSVNNWMEIADYNGLQYPYIVETIAHKKRNLEHLVTYGDLLIIPIEDPLVNIDPQTLSTQDKRLIVELALGKDLSMVALEENYLTNGTTDEILELTHNGRGDLARVIGVENVRQATIAKLLTARGSLLLHPEYGSDLHTMFTKATVEQAKLIELEVCRTVLTDTRVTDVQPMGSTIDGSTYKGEFEAEIQALETSFNFVVEGDGSGVIILT